jgi:hypothetical protein
LKPADHLGLLDALAQRQADHHVARGAEVLHLDLAEAQAPPWSGPWRGRPLRVLHLHHRAAGELDRQVQPARDEEEHRGDEGDEAR